MCIRDRYQRRVHGEATESQKVFYRWFYRTNSMTINGPLSSPKLAMLSQQAGDKIEFGIWDINSMTVTRDKTHPFIKIQRAYGVSVGSYRDSGKIVITVMLPVEREDKLYHLLVSQKTF
eukprot:TRINITY_DN12153_c0_g1_i2.p2 TRINITY_DN12153_c0_g1~~TRINITY_DN12153_c0_g1_i2.p2  ORF type:complete len:119 (-),score=20.02 TRINITY_DN12153_c0_g1_i2:46-402(-)